MRPLRPLKGLRAGISISGAENLEARGFTEAGMNRLTVRFTRSLLDQGATLAFGHDWRDKGIMDAVCRAALDSFGFPGARDPSPRILNLIPWPEETTVSSEILDRLNGILEVHQAGLPPGFEGHIPPDFAFAGPRNPRWRYVRSRGLTHLRRLLTGASAARICLGGKGSNFSGRYPGILEEALFALDAGQPLYLAGLLGGAAEWVGRAILYGAEMPPGFGDDVFREPRDGGPPLAHLYENLAAELPGGGESHFGPLRDEVLDLRGAWDLAREHGARRLTSGNGLSVEDNERLLQTQLEDEAVHLVLKGLRNVCSPSATRSATTS